MIFNVGARGASNAQSIKYDNSLSGLEADNVQGAVDELNDSLKTLEELIYNQLYPHGLPLIPTMTSNTTPVGVASASSNNDSAYTVFDNNDTTGFMLTEKTNGWVQYQFEEPQKATAISVLTNNTDNTVRMKNFTLKGSNDGTDFVDIYSGVYANSLTKQYFDFNNDNAYLYYRLTIKDGYNSNNALGVKEVQLYSK